MDPAQYGAGWRFQQGLEDGFQFRTHEAVLRAEHVAQVSGACTGGALSVLVEPLHGPAVGAGTAGGGMLGPAGLAQGLAFGGPAADAEDPVAAGARLGLVAAVSAQRLAGGGAVVDAPMLATADAHSLLALLGAAGQALGGVGGGVIAGAEFTAGRAGGGGDLPAGGADSAVVGARLPEAQRAADAACPVVEGVVLATGAAHGLTVGPASADRSHASAGRAGRDLGLASARLAAAQAVTALLEVGGALAERARGDDHAMGAAIDQRLGQGGDLGWPLGAASGQQTGGIFQRPQQPDLAGAGAFDRANGLLSCLGRDSDGGGGNQSGQFPGRVGSAPWRMGPAAGPTSAVASGEGGASADHARVGAPEAAVAAGAADACAIAEASQRTLMPAVAAARQNQSFGTSLAQRPDEPFDRVWSLGTTRRQQIRGGLEYLGERPKLRSLAEDRLEHGDDVDPLARGVG
ncbi:hypothetical protein SLNWT_7040 [Streptomyces albus]|uniref:Uncharacterized protein n=1 Tax=Streptomyces albus (strain ATCC 21838 / DSM 41398 / FERM P-419 / JCM 4703 / NBRC 107858) TaxID=1081613 RepID=A0A0B5F9A4_STRA4|nr:hypothetical protein SLNWT_7040 [Streptomyces albus]AOU81719.1 hypothetical protein SLNHY_7028 [Streptomyces albus]AYN37408.1 hypothetical protein DUI70_6916 [Streptomyces albus]